MKRGFFSLCLYAFIAVIAYAQDLNGTSSNQNTLPAPTNYQIVEQGPNHNVWQRETYEKLPSGRIVTHTRRFTELATGLNFQSGGHWAASKEEIDIQPDGTAQAVNGQHQVFWPADILSERIKLVTPEGTILLSQPVGLSYDDGSNTVFIASLTNSVGSVVNSNQVVYADAFVGAGFTADLRYSYTRAGLEQDVILKRRPPTPSSLGLRDEARLQMITEFMDPPQPAIETTTVSEDDGDLTDDQVAFGVMQIGRGKAFMMGTHEPSARVSKQWIQSGGRTFLVEELPVASISEELQALPLMTAMDRKTRTGLYALSHKRLLPPRRTVLSSNKRFTQVSKLETPSPELVLDYQMLSSSQTNFVFQGDTTYYLSGSVNSYGQNVFEGGTVIKYASGVTFQILPHPGTTPAVITEGSPYRPIVFTAVDDNSVGDIVSGSTGSPAGYYGNMLVLAGFTPAAPLTNLRFSYAANGFSCAGINASIYDVQFVNCAYGCTVAGCTVLLRNALFANTKTNFSFGGGGVINLQNATSAGANCVAQGASFAEGNSIALTNCIFSADTNITNGVVTVNANYNGFFASPAVGGNVRTNTFNPFQPTGAGGFYLSNSCAFIQAGTPGIDPFLLSDLAQKTTRPPVIYSNVTLSASSFSPQAYRDTSGTPDLGYHYDPLDYIFGNVSVVSNLTFTAGTAVSWFDSSGFGLKLSDGVTVNYQGTATAPCVFAHYATVQEGVYAAWTGFSYLWFGMAATGSDQDPAISALILPQFTHLYSLAGTHLFTRDYSAVIRIWAQNSEFYNGGEEGFGVGICVTNCLFDRMAVTVQAECCAQIFMRNCTMHGGLLTASHWGDWPTAITNCAFDGTSFNMDLSDTTCDYNAYVTGGPTNPISGSHDIYVIGFNWQSSWFGEFYLPTNSSLIDAGSITADQVGLYHFTTQTNQAVEGNSVVDIGYHYVATGSDGDPIDSNGDGVPDYLEDLNGNGLVDPGETSFGVTIENPSTGSIIY